MTKEIKVFGKLVDDQTRCSHYHGALDIVALKFACCNKYFPCFYCHQEETDHRVQRLSADQFDNKAVLCGKCQSELSVNEYLHSPNCVKCGAGFNPGCANHYHLYFNV